MAKGFKSLTCTGCELDMVHHHCSQFLQVTHRKHVEATALARTHIPSVLTLQKGFKHQTTRNSNIEKSVQQSPCRKRTPRPRGVVKTCSKRLLYQKTVPFGEAKGTKRKCEEAVTVTSANGLGFWAARIQKWILQAQQRRAARLVLK